MFEIGLDISSSRISAVECFKTNKGIFIKNAGIVDIDSSAIEAGELVNPSALIDGLKNLWRIFKFQKKEVNIGLSNTKLVIKEIELPVTNEGEIANALKFQIEDYFPIPKDNIIFDYYIIEKTGTSSKVMIIGAFKNMVDEYMDAVQSSGLIINSIDSNCFPFFRAANYIFNFKSLRLSESGKCFCLVYLGEEISIIQFADENEIRYPRFLNISINNYIESISKKLKTTSSEVINIIRGFDFEKLQIKDGYKKNDATNRLKEANDDIAIEAPLLHKEDDFKKISGEIIYDTPVPFDSLESLYDPDSIVPKDAKNMPAEIWDSLKIFSNQLVNEITRSVDHFLQENRNLKIDKILISGEKLNNLDRYIEKNSSLAVERIDVSRMIIENNARKNPLFATGDLSKISNSLLIGTGLALRGLVK